MLNIAKEVSLVQRMTVDQLRSKYADVFGERTNGRNKRWLIKRIAWRLQANAEGGLMERARQRAMELANGADLRMTPPRERKASEEGDKIVNLPVPFESDARLPLPGTVLVREYKGRAIRATVHQNGFEFEGEKYKSLSAVARAVTGQHWNGYHFFGLRHKRGGK